VEAQAALAAANANHAPDKRVNFRIGIHVGDAMVPLPTSLAMA
jgi:class 3 adenylate cyclase